MKSLWGEYQKELHGKHMLENEHGFIVYSMTDEYIYIEDIYVSPEKRGTRLGHEMTDFVVQIGKKNGCKKLFGSVETKIKDPHKSLMMLIYYGMTLHSVSGSVIYFTKDI